MHYKTSLKNFSRAAGLLRGLALSSLAASVLALPLAAPARAQTAGSAPSKPRLISNTKKYRDTGLAAASGRSGSASLTARALLGRDGQTFVELTTGALDSAAPAPGQITKAQLKPLNGNGEAAYTRNFGPLAGGGTFSTTVNDLRRGQQLQAQANVGGIDPNRADVVTVVETVKLRPDLSAAGLAAPARALVNTAVNLTAVIRELNGDVGARADLVLYVDGAEVDRAHGVWVDANGTVSAAFTHTFTSEGARQLAVKVERVTPGDYNPADNAAAASIEIVSQQVRLNYYSYAYDRHLATRYASDYVYNHDDGVSVSREASKYVYDDRSHTQDVYFYGWAYGASLGFPVSASITELSDDAAVVSASFPRVEADYSYTTDYGGYVYTYGYAYRQDPQTGGYIYVNSYSSKGADPAYNYAFTQVSYSRNAGDVTYHSAGTYRSYYSYQGEVYYDYAYSYNYDYSGAQGLFVPFGSRYGLDVAFTGADGTAMGAAPRMALTPTDDNSSSSFCWEYTYGFSTGRNCYESSYSNQSRDGFAYNYDNQ